MLNLLKGNAETTNSHQHLGRFGRTRIGMHANKKLKHSCMGADEVIHGAVAACIIAKARAALSLRGYSLACAVLHGPSGVFADEGVTGDHWVKPN